MKYYIKLAAIFFLMAIPMLSMAQEITVSGVVADEEGIPVIGASVMIKGLTQVGTITDIDGRFSMKTAPDAILQFSYIGMLTVEVPVDGRNTLEVTMKYDYTELDEVVVIGYGASKRSELTGSVSSVKSEEIMSTPTSDVAQALAGRVAGVQIVQSEGGPGAEVSIRVRGGMSITQSNEPLYVIDGFPTEDGMSDLDPGDIETIDILKDASATAIYGARGANGVVLITTRSGGARDDSKVNVSFDTYVGFGTLAKKLPVLSSEEFVLMDYERSYFLTGEDGARASQNRYGSLIERDSNYAGRFIDWQDLTLGRTTLTHNYRVNVSGGTKDLKYGLSYAYFNSEGAMVYSGSEKHTVSFNVSHNSGKRFSVNARVNYSYNKVTGVGTSEESTRFNKMEQILQYRPTAGIDGSDLELMDGEDPLYEDDESNPMQNPLITAAEEKDDRVTRNLQINAGFTFRFNKHWYFRSNLGSRYRITRRDQFYGENSSTAKRSSINGSVQYTENMTFQISNVLNYEYKVKKHRLTWMLGQEYVMRNAQWVRSSVTNLPNNDIALDDMSLGTPGAITSNVNFDDRLLSFFTRLNYNYGEKYIVQATLRADGSSKFSSNHKWGIFPAVSASWRLIEEDFIKNLNAFSDLRLRAGYGLAGNNNIASYSSLDLLKSASYPSGETVVPGYTPSGIPNAGLQWESNRTFNVGLDLGFFRQRLTVTPEFYLNRSSHLLLNSKVPMSSGFTTMMRNIGKTRNIGVDLTVTSVNIDKNDFTWTTNLNISHNKNEIVALSGEDYFLEEAVFGYNQNTHIIEVGKPVGQFYGFKTIGLYQVEDFDYDAATGTYTLKDEVPGRSGVQPGYWKFEDVDKDGDIDDNDRTVIGNANPLFFGGITNNFSYRGFDLSIFFSFSYGAQVLNATKLTNTKTGMTNKNVLAIAGSSDRWMTVDSFGNSVTSPEALAAMNAGKTVASVADSEQGDNYVHSWAVEDASYLRLSNVTFGYTFPSKWMKKAKIRKLRLYVTGSNLFCLTPYTGFDPEVSTRGNTLTPGVDFGAYPRSRTFVAGLNITF